MSNYCEADVEGGVCHIATNGISRFCHLHQPVKPLDKLREKIIERGKCLCIDWNELSWVLGQIHKIEEEEKAEGH